MIPIFSFTNPERGLPRALVPLRMVPDITDVDAEVVLAWLTVHSHLKLPALLTAWEFNNSGTHGKVRHTFYSGLTNQMRATNSNQAKLALIPPDHFVYSDDLVHAFSDYIDIFISREAALDLGMAIEWNPSLGPNRIIIDQCQDLTATVSASTKRQRSKALTQQRYASWKSKVQQLRAANPRLSHNAACKLVAKELGIVDSETIRKATR